MSATPLLEAGIRPAVPDRYRLGALIRLVCDELSERHVPVSVRSDHDRVARAERHRRRPLGDARPERPHLVHYARSVFIGGLAAELSNVLPDNLDDHALEVAVSRLRRALDVPGLITTVIKRGYRLNAVRVG